MVEVYSVHSFIFGLKYDDNVKGHIVEIIDRDGRKSAIEVSDIEVTASSISCKLIDKEGKKHIVPFVRIRRVLKDGEVVFDNTSSDMSNSKIIKGY